MYHPLADMVIPLSATNVGVMDTRPNLADNRKPARKGGPMDMVLLSQYTK
jgi:hypothetical protein